MTLAYAIHSIRRPVGKTIVDEPARCLIEIDDAEEYARLMELGAIREPTDVEAALYVPSAPEAAAAGKPAKPTKGEKAGGTDGI